MKADVVEQMVASGSMTKTAASHAYDALVSAVGSLLVAGKEVRLAGLGTFTTKHRDARQGRNPQTGAAVSIPAKMALKFSPSSEIKKAMNAKPAKK